MLRIFTACLFLTVAATIAMATPDTPPPEPSILQQRPDRLIVELPNRMIVVAQHLPTSPVVSAQVWVKTGSLYEQEHVGAGLSHFLEHLLSGGTTANRSEDQSNAILGSIGAQTNAATSLDTVRYYINTTADKAPEAIDLLSDWIGHNVVLQAEFDRERDVIQREFEMGRGDPGRIFWKLTQQAYFPPSHPASHPTIGYLDRFLDVTRDQIDDFYHRMYAPNNLLFVVVGDIDPPEVVQQIAEQWKDAEPYDLPPIHLPPSVPRSLDALVPLPTPTTGYADITRPRIRLLWPGTKLASPGDYELDLLAAILGNGETSRLAHTVRDDQRLVTSIDAGNSSFSWGPGFFSVDMELASEGDPAIEATLAQVQRLIDQPVDEQELARAKRRTLASVLLSGQSAQSVASRLARDIIGMGDPDYLEKYAHKVQSLTAQDLQRVAAEYLAANKVTIVKLFPADDDHPVSQFDTPENNSVSQASSDRIDLDNAAVVKRLNQNLVDANARPIIVEAPITTTLDTGLTLIVQRSTVVPGVAMQLYTLGGLLADEPGREGVASTMAAMLDRGTTTRTADEIDKIIEGLGASLATGGGNNSTFATASCLTENWQTVLELLADVVQHPTFPEEEWDKLKPRLLATIDRETDRWHGELRARFREAYYQNHPWSQSSNGRRDVVEALTTDDLRACHSHHFNAANTVISVVGDIDPKQIQQQVTQLFTALPTSEKPFEALRPQCPQTKIENFHTSKPLVAVQIGFGPGITRDHPDYAAIQVLVAVLSDFPSGWLEQALRGKGPGLVYAVGAVARVGSVPGYVAILFNTDSERATEAIKRALAVVDRAKAGDFDDASLARAKARVLADELTSKQSNSARAASLALDHLYGVPTPGSSGASPDSGGAFQKQVNAIDAADLKRAATRYLINPVLVTISNDELDTDALHKILHPIEPLTD